MLKWIGGCLVLVVLLLAGGSWFAMRTMRNSLEPDGSVRMMIAATPHRIYASLSDADSLKTWMSQGNTVTIRRRGPLVVGDSITVQLRQSLGMTQPPMTWRVSEIVPDHMIALELLGGATGRVIGVRRDSLAAIGDSTLVMTTVTSKVLSDTTQSATKGLAADMMLSMVRLQAKLELQGLKGRIEGRAAQQKTSRQP
jgi:uncharacterized protein YndB with AHSA1/START domain